MPKYESSSPTPSSPRQRAAIYRKAAEASLLHANGSGIATGDLHEPFLHDPEYTVGEIWDREQWCMAYCLLSAMAATGDA